MTIDTKRLATDPGYWDECDPSGGIATHYCPDDAFHTEGWLKGNENHAYFMFAGGGSWHKGSKIESNCIPRPQKPEVEWDKDLPKTNTDCEMADGEGVFVEVRIVSRVDGYAIGWCPEREMVYFSKDPEDFRPIRTKQQRQRDELAKFLQQRLLRNDCKDIADSIIAAGWKKDD